MKKLGIKKTKTNIGSHQDCAVCHPETKRGRSFGKLISADEARIAIKQHTKPCSDCPFARDAFPGWLGSMSIDEWIQSIHGEAMIECHTLLGAQCVGSSIYRANVCKKPRDKKILVLPPDKEICFSSPDEFAEHHNLL